MVLGLLLKKNKMKYDNLEKLVLEWAKEKGILTNGTPIKQSIKTNEEALELTSAIADGNRAEIEDALGDILVTIIIQAKMQNMDLLDCLEGAYNVISNRTGKMVDGQFVKDV
jgi:NTP pyrophosphatase (non-canonical NTP hydrolase)